jgi:hypothetical protein
VPDKELQGTVSKVDDIIEAMGMASGLLTDCMERIVKGEADAHQHRVPRACTDYDVLLCILSHRADRIASKYLKEQRKMPKIDGKRRGIFF